VHWLRTGRLHEAVDHYERALDRWPTYADAHANLASALLRSGDAERAVEHYRQALAGKPD